MGHFGNESLDQESNTFLIGIVLKSGLNQFYLMTVSTSNDS